VFIFYNPHVDDFLAEPIHFRLLKRRALKKYGFLIDELCKVQQTVPILIDGTASGMIPESIFHRLPAFIRTMLAAIEFWIWKRINGFGSEIVRVKPARNSSPDTLLAFSYKAATGKFELRRELLSRYRIVVMHLSHYFVASGEKAKNLKLLPNVVLAGDSNPSAMPYFKTYFDWYSRPFLVLPFAVADRFSIRRPWGERESRAVATGSFHDLERETPAWKYADFMRSGFTTYHPVRKAIHDSAGSLTHWVECRVAPYREYQTGRVARFVGHFQVSQKSYFAVDIVDLYNGYKFAVIGEEHVGFPALGALEAMACGAVLIAQPDYYEGLGLIAGEHYIAYKGTIDHLVKAITQANHATSSRISAAGAKFVKDNYGRTAVFARWVDTLQRLEGGE
jgi:hypothetical protein